MTNSPASLPPSKIPGASSGSGQYIGLAAVLLVVMGGLLFWKFRAQPETPVDAPPVPSASAAPVRPKMDAPPPPPDDDPTPAPSASAGKKAAPGGGGGFGCGATTCTGTPAGSMKGELQARAGNARGCYERALRQNPNLQGRVVVSVRIDQSGNVCQAGISQDTVGGDVGSCILPMFRGAHVAPPTGGCVDVTVPLNFTPKNK
jgi:hypothetical protein